MNNSKTTSAKSGFKQTTGFFSWLFSKENYNEYTAGLKAQPVLSKDNSKK